MPDNRLHGYSDHISLRQSAQHEAGHVLVNWLHDRYLMGVIASEKGGVTAQVALEGQEDTLMYQLLLALAGMHMSHDREVIDDLRENLGRKRYFNSKTDSAVVAKCVEGLKDDQLPLIIHANIILSKFRTRFARAFNELVQELMSSEKHLLDPEQSYNLYGKWDLEYGFDKRPKSDYVMRVVARQFGMEVPKCKWIGWGMEPLEGWEYKRPTLEEIARAAKKQFHK